MKQRSKSVVRQIRTLRSVGAGGGRLPPATRWARSNARPYRDCPPHLTGLARTQWEELVQHMSRAGTLGVENAAILERFCVLFARWREAEAKVAEMGAVIPAPISGVPMPNPWLSIANAAGASISFAVLA